ncbi:MAG: SPOR domain-containing protein [Dissulfurispiraceae bacterium]
MSERSSILLLGRNTVVIGAFLITIASFGIGYFFGFRGSGSSDQEKQVVQSTKTPEGMPLDENRIIDLPLKDVAKKPTSAQSPPAKLSEPVKEASAQNAPEQVAEQVTEKATDKAAEKTKPKSQSQVEAEPPATQNTSKGPNSKLHNSETSTAPSPANQVTADASVQSDQPASAGQSGSASAKTGRHAGAKAKKKAKSTDSSVKPFSVQMGAFPNKEGAEQLFQKLKASGYKPYIVNANGSNTYFKVRIGSFKNKKVAEKSAAELLKKTGLQNFVTAAP